MSLKREKVSTALLYCQAVFCGYVEKNGIASKVRMIEKLHARYLSAIWLFFSDLSDLCDGVSSASRSDTPTDVTVYLIFIEIGHAAVMHRDP